MTKKIMVVVLVVLMLALGGTRVKAKSCEEIGSRTVNRCEGDNCYKNGSTSPHYVYILIIKYRCWENSGVETYYEDAGSPQRSGCC